MFGILLGLVILAAAGYTLLSLVDLVILMVLEDFGRKNR